MQVIGDCHQPIEHDGNQCFLLIVFTHSVSKIENHYCENRNYEENPIFGVKNVGKHGQETS
jgi:hypothetical protein